MESIKGNAIQAISGYAVQMSPSMTEQLSVVPLAWAADRMETVHRSKQRGSNSLKNLKTLWLVVIRHRDLHTNSH